MNDKMMPALFIGHGSPMNAIEDNEFSRAWKDIAQMIPRPEAILCISAHWETRGIRVTAMEHPRTIHDFYGFPGSLFEVQYPTPGSPDLSARMIKLMDQFKIQPDYSWGLDHGTWSVLCHMYPEALVPVVQLSLDRNRATKDHYLLGQQLKALRQQGVLILGSGNIVHNLGVMVWEDTAFDWATEYDAKVRQWILDEQHEPIIQYEKSGEAALLSVNTAEHYLPLLYILGLKEKGEPISFFAEKIWGGSISMRCVMFG